MTSREIIVSVLREHLISRKIAEQIVDVIIARTNADYERQVKKAGLEVK
jgi:Asp-tRNA(Asn)/Glu-tRNA(Gln) amidotransferase B subunit